MAQETVDIFETIAKGTVTLGELKAALADAKKALEGMNVGEAEYQKQLKDVITLQNAVRGAMNGTTASMEDVAKAADGTAKTYNGLVNQMANMKRELRNIDVSTEEGAKAFDDLARKINAVNDELKEMDAKKGDFQRNVGNYKSALDGLGGVLTQVPPTLGKAKKELGDLGQTMQLVGKQPILGIIGLLAPLIAKIAEGVKENESALAGVKKMMDALKPVMDFFSGIMQTVVEYVGDLISQAASFLSSNGIFNQVIKGVMGVGNAVLQFVIAPFKGIVAAIKVFQEEGVKGIGNAARAFGAEMKSGVAFRENFNAGQTVADTIVAGAKSRKADVRKAGKENAEDLLEGIRDGLTEGIEGDIQKEFDALVAGIDKAAEDENKRAQRRESERLKDLEKGAAHRKELNEILTEDEREKANQRYAIQKDADEKRLALMRQFASDAIARGDWDAYIAYDREIADLEVQIETDKLREEKRLRELDVKDAKESAEKKMAVMGAYASGVSSLASGLADILEAQGEDDERAVRMAKNLRIAAATMDMIQGAVTAYSTAQQLGPAMGPIVGALNAAAVVASGKANIAKIRATNVSKDSAPSTAVPDASAPVAAPAMPAAVPTTAVVNGARTETALNRASEPQKVYILQSDIEAAGDTSRVQVAESSF